MTDRGKSIRRGRKKKVSTEEYEEPTGKRLRLETPPFEKMENPRVVAETFLEQVKPLLIGQPLRGIFCGGLLTSHLDYEETFRLYRYYEEECNGSSTQDHRIMNYIPWGTFPVIFLIGENQLEFDFGKAWRFQLHFNTVSLDDAIDAYSKKIRELSQVRKPHDVSCIYGRHAIGAIVTDITMITRDNQVEVFLIHLSNGNIINVHEDTGAPIVWVDITNSEYYKMKLPYRYTG